MTCRLYVLAFCIMVSAGAAPAQTPPVAEKIGDHQLRLGQIRVDTAKREITVPGNVNTVTVLEFVANTHGGMKAYESALTLDTDAIAFNTALVLIGMDKANSRAPSRHFDPDSPAGDPVEIWVEWQGAGTTPRRIRVEQLMFDKSTNRPMPESPWVYTGSSFLADGRYLAEADGVLIGFVHSAAPVIENSRGAGIDKYGSIVLNPNLGLAADTPITLRIRSLKTAPGGKK